MSRLGACLLLLCLLLAACRSGGGPGQGASPTPTTAADGEIVLAAVGDVMLGRSIGDRTLRYGAADPFRSVAVVLREADVAFANLESPISDRGTAADKDFMFRAPPLAVRSLAVAGLDVVSFANNHALDYGLEAFSDTLAALDGAGITVAGAGDDVAAARQPALLSLDGLRLAFLAYVNTPDDSVSGFSVAGTAAGPGKAGVAWASGRSVAEDVARAAQAADIVVVSLHTGFEFQETPNDLQVELAHAAIDAGADVVLGHHPHVLQGIEEYGGGLIIYSLGNFVFDFDALDYAYPGLPSALSVILRVHLDRDGVRGYDYLPVIIDEADGRPRLASGEEARRVEERMARLTAALAAD